MCLPAAQSLPRPYVVVIRTPLSSHTPLSSAQTQQCVDIPSPCQCPDPPQKMAAFAIELIHKLWNIVLGLRVGRAVPVIVSSYLRLSVFSSAYFSGGMKAAALRTLVPANCGFMLYKKWVDNDNRPSSSLFVAWVGRSPLGGPAGRDENQA